MTTYRIESSSFDRTNVIIDHRSLMDKISGWYFFKENKITILNFGREKFNFFLKIINIPLKSR